MSEEEGVTGEAMAEQPTADLRAYLGDSYPILAKYAAMLTEHGLVRGLIGPREIPKIWDRHILNCALLTQAIPDRGVIADVGSGAGLPGIVLAAMRPNAEIVLIETMERRVAWLEEVVSVLELQNVQIHRARAEELDGVVEADVVTARAVAALDKLARWCFPLAKVGGELVFLKGERVHQEIQNATKVLRKYAAVNPTVITVQPVPNYSSATIVRLRRGK